MLSKWIWILSLPLLFHTAKASAQYSADLPPEVFYQPQSENFAISLSYSKMTPDTATEVYSGDTKILTTSGRTETATLKLGYGILTGWAVSLSTDWGTTYGNIYIPALNSKAENKTSGMGDISFESTHLMGPGNWGVFLLWGGATNIGVKKNSYSINSTVVEGNRSSGAPSGKLGLGSFFGFDGDGAVHSVGFNSFRVFRGKGKGIDMTSTPETYTLTERSFSTVEIFYQLAYDDFSMDGKVTANYYDPRISEYADGTIDEDAGYETAGLGFGMQYQLTEWMNIRIEGLGMSYRDDIGATSKILAYNAYYSMARLRFEF